MPDRLTDERPDYTEIRDDRIRSKICELMSEMLDNPDEHEIYATGRFMWKMETFILAELLELRKENERLQAKVYDMEDFLKQNVEDWDVV